MQHQKSNWSRLVQKREQRPYQGQRRSNRTLPSARFARRDARLRTERRFEPLVGEGEMGESLAVGGIELIEHMIQREPPTLPAHRTREAHVSSEALLCRVSYHRILEIVPVEIEPPWREEAEDEDVEWEGR